MLVKEYVKNAEPVSSKILSKKRGFKVCPATIRNEFQELTDKGYIFQPHTSAGRAPTTKAYRFLVDMISDEESILFKGFFDTFNEIERDASDEIKYIEQMSKNLASETSNLVFTYFPGRDYMFKEGWEGALQSPEFQEKSFLDEFIQEVAYLEKNIKKLAEASQKSEISVYIGKESPFLKLDGFSLTITKSTFPNKEEGIVAMLGPARTGYEKNIALLKSLIKSLEDF